MSWKEIQLKQHQNQIILEQKVSQSRRPVRADCCSKFRLIYVKSEPHNIFVKNFVMCKDCEEINHYNGCTATKLTKHVCSADRTPKLKHFIENPSYGRDSSISFSNSDKLMMKTAMSNFVVGNLHSIAKDTVIPLRPECFWDKNIHK